MTIENGSRLKITQAITMSDNVEAINVYYMEADFAEGQTEADVVLVCEEWVELLYTTIDDLVADVCSLAVMTVYEFDSVLNQWDKIGEGAPDVTFTDVTTMLPHGVSALVRAYTTRPRTIGRKYLPGLTETQHTGSGWDTGTLTALAAFGVQWASGKQISLGNNIRPAVFSKALEAVYRLSGTEVVLADAAYQRRRRPGVGT